MNVHVRLLAAIHVGQRPEVPSCLTVGLLLAICCVAAMKTSASVAIETLNVTLAVTDPELKAGLAPHQVWLQTLYSLQGRQSWGFGGSRPPDFGQRGRREVVDGS